MCVLVPIMGTPYTEIMVQIYSEKAARNRMSGQTPSVSRQPPAWLFKHIVNPIMKTLLRSPLHGLLSNGLIILSFKGSKSGKVFSTPVAYHQLDAQTLMVMTRSAWWKNFSRGETVTVRLKGQVYQGTPTITLDNEVVWGHISRFLAEHHNPRRVGIMVAADASPAEIRQAAADMLAITIALK
jgi:hypothetical protein